MSRPGPLQPLTLRRPPPISSGRLQPLTAPREPPRDPSFPPGAAQGPLRPRGSRPRAAPNPSLPSPRPGSRLRPLTARPAPAPCGGGAAAARLRRCPPGLYRQRQSGPVPGTGALPGSRLLPSRWRLKSSPVSRSSAARMEAVVRRCPFLARVSQAFLQKAGPSLLLYAQHCPRMMEAAPPAAARALATSAARGQQAEEEKTPAGRRGEYGRRGAAAWGRASPAGGRWVTVAVAGSLPRDRPSHP